MPTPQRSSVAGFNLTDQQREQIRAEIEAFYVDVLDEELNDLRTDQVLDFFTETLAPIVYNAALDDAKTWATQRFEDMSLDYSLLYRDTDNA